MSRVRHLRLLVVATVACCSLTAVASAGAAAWQGPISISDPAPVQVGDTTARIALGVSGDAAAGWTDDDQMGGPTRLILVRRRAGGAWSPTVVTTGINAQPIFVGVDAAGDVTAAYENLSVTQIVSWAAGSATPTITPLNSAPVDLAALAVNASGDAVVSGVGTGGKVVVAYRHGFGGAWSGWHGFTGPNFSSGLASTVAINASGMAVVLFRTFSELWAATRTPAADWPTAAGLVTSTPVNTNDTPSVAINAAGGIWAAFTAEPAATMDVLRTSFLQAPTSAWEESGDLTTATSTNFQQQIVMNPAGTALLTWQQTSASAIQARYGSTGSRIWGPVETVNDAGADVPAAAIGNDGTAVVAWERFVGGGNLGQARVRSPGPGGTWSDIRNLTPLHPNANQPSVSTDGVGDFVTITAPYDGTSKHAMISVYDAALPSTTPIASSGTGLAGDPMTFTVSASDGWSTVGVPTWTFGDGASGTGASVAHTYGAAGTYTVHVSVTDGSGNTSGRDATVTIGLAQSTLTTARFTAKWKVSRVSGTLLVGGTAPRAGTYAIDVTKGKKRPIHVSFTLPVGVFSKKLKLPATLVPGSYHVALQPAATNVTGAARDVKLAAPASGVVDVAFLSGARNGTAARTLTGATTIWANFHFAAKPKGKVLLTWYRLGKKRVRLGSTSKNAAVKIVSFLGSAAPFAGRFQAVLSRKGVTIARATVKAKR
jgi:PKD domain-containing protein